MADELLTVTLPCSLWTDFMKSLAIARMTVPHLWDEAGNKAVMAFSAELGAESWEAIFRKLPPDQKMEVWL